jgi:Holliday junction resolvase RusA-like endonuclease
VDNFIELAMIARRDHISRPDLDNMVKFVLDAMQGVVYNARSCLQQ